MNVMCACTLLLGGALVVQESRQLPSFQCVPNCIQDVLQIHNISVYGFCATKISPQLMTKVIAMRRDFTAKTHNYNFQGQSYINERRFDDGRIHDSRQWVVDFSKSHFTDHDLLVFTDVTEEHVPLGTYDHTIERLQQEVGGRTGKYCDIDEFY